MVRAGFESTSILKLLTSVVRRFANAYSVLLSTVCFCILFGILVAGLWPFHAPRNEVSWSTGGKGLFFGKHGSVLTANPFKARGPQEAHSCSLQIALEPRRIDLQGTFLSFYWPERRLASFVLRQWYDGLVLEHYIPHSHTTAHRFISGVFSAGKLIFLTIASDDRETSAYVDGTLIETLPGFTISNRDITGRLLLGNAPSVNDSWSGLMSSLVIYDRELTAGEVSTAFRGRLRGIQPEAISNNGLVARYAFQEGVGNIAHNQVDAATDLVIPDRFFLLHQHFLQRPWAEFHPRRWSYWTNIAINILGFVPLGFFFYAYFYQVAKLRHAAAVTVTLGFLVSLTIEVLQAFLPVRDSGMTDLVTNTLGTAIGMFAFRENTVPGATESMMCREEPTVSPGVGQLEC